MDSTCNGYGNQHIKASYKDVVRSPRVCPDVDWKIREMSKISPG